MTWRVWPPNEMMDPMESTCLFRLIGCLMADKVSAFCTEASANIQILGNGRRARTRRFGVDLLARFAGISGPTPEIIPSHCCKETVTMSKMEMVQIIC